MKILIIAEKPSVANKISMALQSKNKKRMGGFTEDENYVITNCFGHLFEQVMPQDIDEKYKTWKMDNLPFYFDRIPMKVKDDKGIKDQVKTIVSLIKRDDISEIVNACDNDREGERIFRDIYYFSKTNKPATRIWLEATTDDDIKREFKERLPEQMYDNLYNSAVARSYSDYFIGLNGTQAMSIKFGNGKPLTVGRVQTPILRIIVDLEKEINNFVSKPFWTLSCDTLEGFSANYKNDDLPNNHFLKHDDVLNIKNKVGLGKALVTNANMSITNEKAPKLFNLSDLQIEMNRKYKYSAQTVLSACQSLYEEYSLTTYPRTSENRISEGLANMSYKIIDALNDAKFGKQKQTIFSNNYKINPSCIAKKDIDAHEALTPTTKKVTDQILASLSEVNLRVYLAIVERFLINFYPNVTYNVQDIEIVKNEEKFTASFKSIKDRGYYDALLEQKSDVKEQFVNIKTGDYVEITALNISEGKTSPPTRFTEGTLIKTLVNPSKYLEDAESKKIIKEAKGIGTEATRASILEEIKHRGFITVSKGTIYPTEMGMRFIDLIPSEKIKSIPLTVNLEQNLKQIQSGTLDKKVYLNEIKDFLIEFVDDVKKSENKNQGGTKMENELCKCPNCKSSIVETKFSYGCSNYKNGCKVGIYFNGVERLGKKTITKKEAIELLTNGKTSNKCKGFVSAKTGKAYEAYINYKYDENEKYPNQLAISFE